MSSWTKGPWLYRPKSGSWHVEPPADTNYKYGEPFIETLDSCDMHFHNDADAELIALAPEMAEAILAMEGSILSHPHPDGPEDAIDLLLTIADKLRRIGANDE